MSSKNISELIPGVHQPMIDAQEWATLQLQNRSRKNHPGTARRPGRVYEFKGVGKCWVCWEMMQKPVPLRGSPGGRNRYPTYRCGALQDWGTKRKKTAQVAIQNAARAAGLEFAHYRDRAAWKDAHHSLSAYDLSLQIEAYLHRFEIPRAWHQTIQAFYMHDDGKLHFESQLHNLRREQVHLQELRQAGNVTMAQFLRQGAELEAKRRAFWLRELNPSEVALPLLKDFPELWKQLNSAEKNSLLNMMFEGLYFDGHGRLRWILAHSPFDRLLGLPEGGIMLELDK